MFKTTMKTILDIGSFMLIILTISYLLSAFSAWNMNPIEWADYIRLFFVVITASMYSGFVALGNKGINK